MLVLIWLGRKYKRSHFVNLIKIFGKFYLKNCSSVWETKNGERGGGLHRWGGIPPPYPRLDINQFRIFLILRLSEGIKLLCLTTYHLTNLMRWKRLKCSKHQRCYFWPPTQSHKAKIKGRWNNHLPLYACLGNKFFPNWFYIVIRTDAINFLKFISAKLNLVLFFDT